MKKYKIPVARGDPERKRGPGAILVPRFQLFYASYSIYLGARSPFRKIFEKVRWDIRQVGLI